jgi:hypothetical protein
MLSICEYMKADIGPLLHYTAEKSEKLALVQSWLTTRQSDYRIARVIPPFLTGLCSRIHAAAFSFCADVMPPMPILGRSLL